MKLCCLSPSLSFCVFLCMDVRTGGLGTEGSSLSAELSARERDQQKLIQNLRKFQKKEKRKLSLVLSFFVTLVVARCSERKDFLLSSIYSGKTSLTQRASSVDPRGSCVRPAVCNPGHHRHARKKATFSFLQSSVYTPYMFS